MLFKTQRMRWAGHIAHIGRMRNTNKILAGKHEGKHVRDPGSIGGTGW